MPGLIQRLFSTAGKAKKSARRRGRAAAWSPARRRALLAGGLAVAVAAGTGWAAWSGAPAKGLAQLGDRALALTTEWGFAVGEVMVIGRHHTERAALLAALDVARGMPILAVDLPAARDRIEALPWVEGVVIERRLPDVIVIRLIEREPLALWQHERRFSLIDRTGAILATRGLGRFADLPLVVGAGADRAAAALLAQLARRPALAARVHAASRVGDRRWDLHFQNGVIARLPSDGAGAALDRLARLTERDRILDNAILAIDLRQTDRLVIKTTPLGAELRTLPEEKT